jgi:hypothetical protein
MKAKTWKVIIMTKPQPYFLGKDEEDDKDPIVASDFTRASL